VTTSTSSTILVLIDLLPWAVDPLLAEAEASPAWKMPYRVAAEARSA